MADEDNDNPEENDDQEKKGGPGIVGIVLPAILAGAGAFGGAYVAGGAPTPAAAEETPVDDGMPGPTVPLMPFVLNIADDDGSAHPMKITLAVELKKGADAKAFESFLPRVRDTCIAYFRSLPYKEAADGRSKEKITSDLLAQIHKQGAEAAEQILIQDYVIQ